MSQQNISYTYSMADTGSRSSHASRRIARDMSVNVDNSRYGPVWDDPPSSCACCVCCGASTTSAIVRLFTAIFAMASVAFLVAGMIIKNAIFTCGGSTELDFALWEVKGASIGTVSSYSDTFVLASRILLIVGGAVGALGCLLIMASVFVVCCFCIQRRREDIYSPEGRHEEAERQRRDRGVSMASLLFAGIACVVEIPPVVILGIWYATKMPKLSATSSPQTSTSYRNTIAACGSSKGYKFELGYWFLVVGAGCAIVTFFFTGIDACVKPNPKPERARYRDTTGLSRSGSFVSSGSSVRSGGGSVYTSSMRGPPPPPMPRGPPSQNGSFHDGRRRSTVPAPMYPMESGSRRAVNPLYDEKGSRTPSRSSSMRYYQ